MKNPESQPNERNFADFHVGDFVWFKGEQRMIEAVYTDGSLLLEGDENAMEPEKISKNDPRQTEKPKPVPSKRKQDASGEKVLSAEQKEKQREEKKLKIISDYKETELGSMEQYHFEEILDSLKECGREDIVAVLPEKTWESEFKRAILEVDKALKDYPDNPEMIWRKGLFANDTKIWDHLFGASMILESYFSTLKDSPEKKHLENLYTLFSARSKYIRECFIKANVELIAPRPLDTITDDDIEQREDTLGPATRQEFRNVPEIVNAVLARYPQGDPNDDVFVVNLESIGFKSPYKWDYGELMQTPARVWKSVPYVQNWWNKEY